MRIVTWNINGVRTLPKYHPWNGLGSWRAILDGIGASIVCFQEMKTTRQQLDRATALPDGYDSFFSFPMQKGGYSGVAVYTKRADAVPFKAEEGLSARLQPTKAPLSAEERVSRAYPDIDDLAAEFIPNDDGSVPQDVLELDGEGRALVLDFGLFVLVNLYCPAETSDARIPFKANFHRLLGERLRILRAEGRGIIVVGDINICSTPLDHCDFTLPSTHETFFERETRVWMRDLLEPVGPFVDVVRRFHPGRKGMYTCWNTRINARDSNYGTRIDYILCTSGLLPWMKGGDIQASVKGSDHCPVYVDLHDEIVGEDGNVVRLRDAMKQMPEPHPPPPRLAACYWDVFSTRQTVLGSFFGKGAAAKKATTAAVTAAETQVIDDDISSLPSSSQLSTQSLSTSSQLSTLTVETDGDARDSPSTPSSSQQQLKRTPSTPSAKPKLKPKPATKKSGQMKLSSFLKQSSAPAQPASSSTSPTPPLTEREQIDADYEFARLLAASEEAPSPSSSQPNSNSASKTVWSSLLAPVKPPCCDVHGKPTLRRTTTKQGPNKGKVFYICSMPLGPGYDAGRGKRLREEVDPQYKCDYFKWESDVKREALRKGEPAAKRPRLAE
ncbi:DNase I-like protein [Auricularia subglabra TFB-10046 SS5]|nr:DNase I-like protein [Auricularia subglabra TFB-10046 SS5]